MTRVSSTISVPSGRQISKLAWLSLRNFFPLIFQGSLALPKEKLGGEVWIEQKGAYSIFRETINKRVKKLQPTVLVVGFRLKRIRSQPVWHYLFQRICILTTPFWSGLPGFDTKLWMVDSSKNYLGIYAWQGHENAMKYLSALLPVLRFFSTNDSVWHRVYENQKLDDFLTSGQLKLPPNTFNYGTTL